VIGALLKSTLRIGLVFVIGTLGCVYFLGNTSRGLQVSLNLAALFSQGQLHIGKAEGKLFSGFTLEDVNYHSAYVELTINSIKLAWDLKEIPNKLTIESLQTQDFTLKIHESKTLNQFDYKSLAVLERLTVKDLHLENVTYIDGASSAIKFAEISLQKTAANTAVFYAQTLGGELNGNISLLFANQVKWSVLVTGQHINPGLQWREWPGEINFALYTQGKLGNESTGPDVLFQLQQLDGTLRNYPLHGHINVVLKDHQLDIKEGQLSNGSANINFNGGVTATWNLNWNIQLPDLSLLLPDVHGSFASQGSLRGPRAEPTVVANIEAAQLAYAEHHIKRLVGKINFAMKPEIPFSLSLSGYDIKVKEQKLKQLDLAITGKTHKQNNQLMTTLAIAVGQKPYINAQINLPATISTDNYANADITALVDIHFPNLATLQNTVPMVTDLRGALLGKLQVSGKLSHPIVNGEVNLSNGNVGLPKLGITFKNITLRLLADASRRATYQGSFKLGTGTATLQGVTDFNSKDYATTLQLHGSNLQVANLPEYKIQASPDLTLHLNNFKVAIEGNIAIPEAKLTPKDFRRTVTLPDDIVFVGKPVTQTPSAASLLAAMPTLQISVQLKNHILLHYQDLETTLGGALTIHAAPNQPATAIGSLFTIGGTYHAYGQVLNIQVGKLTYTGGLLINPGLNIKASREITTPNTMANSATNMTQTYIGSGTINVGVQLLGTLNKPAITLFSVPGGMSQDDILSYLVLGIPRSQASAKDSMAILNATSAVGLGGNGVSQLANITKKLQDGLGLAEMNVQTVQTFDPNAGNTVGSTSLVLGKAISKKLYVHYSVSLFSSTPVSVFNMRYKFNKHWSVQTETSTIDNGADLLYTIEQN
jgi:translocation and assembly module TamB